MGVWRLELVVGNGLAKRFSRLVPRRGGHPRIRPVLFITS